MKDFEYDVCILGGLGHVGLPLGIFLANTGKKVLLYDISEETAEIVSRGEMPFSEPGMEDMLKNVIGKTLFISSDKASISKGYFLIIVIGTPVDEFLNPKRTIFRKFFDSIIEYIRDDQHIILRSTVFPGTTQQVKEYLEVCGKSAKLSFCPERIAEGKALEELGTLPQIIASFDEESRKEAQKLFSHNDVLFLEPLEAELAKLFTNAWRYINFAVANQFYQLVVDYDVDFYKIYDAIRYNYPRARQFPAAGFAAGPCLLKDTMQLAAFSNNKFFLGHSAMLINEGLPNIIVQRLKDRYALKEKTVGILGMAFKGNSNDIRGSLAYKLKKILETEAKTVLCSDSYIEDPDFVSAEELLRGAEIIILGAPHKIYKELSIDKEKVLVDVWNFYEKGGLF